MYIIIYNYICMYSRKKNSADVIEYSMVSGISICIMFFDYCTHCIIALIYDL